MRCDCGFETTAKWSFTRHQSSCRTFLDNRRNRLLHVQRVHAQRAALPAALPPTPEEEEEVLPAETPVYITSKPMCSLLSVKFSRPRLLLCSHQLVGPSEPTEGFSLHATTISCRRALLHCLTKTLRPHRAQGPHSGRLLPQSLRQSPTRNPRVLRVAYGAR
jgi:hypothetical protein